MNNQPLDQSALDVPHTILNPKEAQRLSTRTVEPSESPAASDSERNEFCKERLIASIAEEVVTFLTNQNELETSYIYIENQQFFIPHFEPILLAILQSFCQDLMAQASTFAQRLIAEVATILVIPTSLVIKSKCGRGRLLPRELLHKERERRALLQEFENGLLYKKLLNSSLGALLRNASPEGVNESKDQVYGFLLFSRAFKHLRVKLSRLELVQHEPLHFCGLRLSLVPAKRLKPLVGKADLIKCKINKYAYSPILWWPLKRPDTSCPPDYTRVLWNCFVSTYSQLKSL